LLVNINFSINVQMIDQHNDRSFCQWSILIDRSWFVINQNFCLDRHHLSLLSNKQIFHIKSAEPTYKKRQQGNYGLWSMKIELGFVKFQMCDGGFTPRNITLFQWQNSEIKVTKTLYLPIWNIVSRKIINYHSAFTLYSTVLCVTSLEHKSTDQFSYRIIQCSYFPGSHGKVEHCPRHCQQQCSKILV